MPRPPKVLVIDDHAVVRESLTVLLEHHGYDVHQAENGRAGLRAARETAPDLIITNLEMPEIDGSAVLDAVKRDPNLQEVPVIVLTFHYKPGERKRSLKAGAFAFIDKSSPVEELLQTLKEAVGDNIGGPPDIVS